MRYQSLRGDDADCAMRSNGFHVSAAGLVRLLPALVEAPVFAPLVVREDFDLMPEHALRPLDVIFVDVTVRLDVSISAAYFRSQQGG